MFRKLRSLLSRLGVCNASHARTTGGTFQVVQESAALRIIPLNSEAKATLDAYFTAHGSKTTVAFTQEDAGRDGQGQTSEAYKSLLVTAS